MPLVQQTYNILSFSQKMLHGICNTLIFLSQTHNAHSPAYTQDYAQ